MASNQNHRTRTRPVGASSTSTGTSTSTCTGMSTSTGQNEPVGLPASPASCSSVVPSSRDCDDWSRTLDPHVGLLLGEYLETLADGGPRALLTHLALFAPRPQPLVEVHLLGEARVGGEDHGAA